MFPLLVPQPFADDPDAKLSNPDSSSVTGTTESGPPQESAALSCDSESEDLSKQAYRAGGISGSWLPLNEPIAWQREALPYYRFLLPAFLLLLAALLFLPLNVLKHAQRIIVVLPVWLVVFLGVVAMCCTMVNYVYHARRLVGGLRPPKALSPQAVPLHHVVVILAYKEPIEVLRRTFASLVAQRHPHRRLTLVLGCEARDSTRHEVFASLKKEFEAVPERMILTEHVLAPGEAIGKSSNENWAVREVYRDLVDEQGLDPFEVMLTIADADSVFSDLYVAKLEEAFWSERDGRRLIFCGPLNTYRNIALADPVTQMYEIMRSHDDSFHSPISPYQPQSNYSLTLGFCKEIDFWTPDNMPEDVHTHRKAQINNLCSLTTKPIPAFICNDLVERFPDRYIQAKRHIWGVTEIAWVAALRESMSPVSWWHIVRVEATNGTFAKELYNAAASLLRLATVALVLYQTSFLRHAEVITRHTWICIAVYCFVQAHKFFTFWVMELFLWRRILTSFDINTPSSLRWVVLVLFSPVLCVAAYVCFHFVPLFHCLGHAAFVGDLVYVTAPKGTAPQRDSLKRSGSTLPA